MYGRSMHFLLNAICHFQGRHLQFLCQQRVTVDALAEGLALPISSCCISRFDPNYPHVLNQFSILHYFELSPFFDRTCNNTLARQQGHDPAVPGALEFVVPQGGMEYVLELAQVPHLFLIRKHVRKGPDAAAPGALSTLAYYYVLDKVIYQAPTLHAVLSSRIRRCAWGLHQGFGKLQADLDPLKAQLRKREKILQQEQQQQRHQQQQQQDMGAETGAAGAPVRSSGVAKAETAVDEQQGVGKAAAAPMPTVQRVNAADAAQWRRTDNIIMAVLSRYEVPEMPASYYTAPRRGMPAMSIKPLEEPEAQGVAVESAAPPSTVGIELPNQQPAGRAVGGQPQQQDAAAPLARPQYQPMQPPLKLEEEHDVKRGLGGETTMVGWSVGDEIEGLFPRGSIPKKKRTRSGVMR
ncbi:MED6 mediator sub complex component-domain-containing protein [Dunaliella salina]|uniref:MED6 mediator sub complex component-domain-containing protein n=1 Tax=Dunaliella salina TaxID=3046 RepID=A0ABQ7GFC1_DUNSA|nr:MED6 mediator sub complex component-domain-containing protein [Dunaliella salina]|eukprot:KAF5833298.1 MED6 mediator sub complex component-domain-containing protein [Dunaliella salina]